MSRYKLPRRLEVALVDSNEEELAAEIGESSSVLSLWKRGQAHPNALQLHALCEALGLSADYLIGRCDDPLEEALDTSTVVATLLRGIGDGLAAARLSDEQFDRFRRALAPSGAASLIGGFDNGTS